MTVFGKKITWKALNPVMHSFVTITTNRSAKHDSATGGDNKKQAHKGACRKLKKQVVQEIRIRIPWPWQSPEAA
jgi:hypothetical protein